MGIVDTQLQAAPKVNFRSSKTPEGMILSYFFAQRQKGSSRHWNETNLTHDRWDPPLVPFQRTVRTRPPCPASIPAHSPRVRSVRSLTRLNVKNLPPPSLAKLTTPFLNLRVRAASSWGNFWLGTYIKGLRLCRLRRPFRSNACRQSSSSNPFSAPWIMSCGGYRGRICDFGKGLNVYGAGGSCGPHKVHFKVVEITYISRRIREAHQIFLPETVLAGKSLE
jgi:hypothetical protein